MDDMTTGQAIGIWIGIIGTVGSLAVATVMSLPIFREQIEQAFKNKKKKRD